MGDRGFKYRNCILEYVLLNEDTDRRGHRQPNRYFILSSLWLCGKHVRASLAAIIDAPAFLQKNFGKIALWSFQFFREHVSCPPTFFNCQIMPRWKVKCLLLATPMRHVRCEPRLNTSVEDKCRGSVFKVFLKGCCSPSMIRQVVRNFAFV